MRRYLVPVLAALLFCTTACMPAQDGNTPESTGTYTVTPPPTDTPTIQWFPPTHTPTPLITATILPTAEQRPGVGELVFQDAFIDEGDWQIMRNENGNVALGNQELTIAIMKPGGQLASLRSEPVLGDYYMEITASASLCRQADAYGVIARANGEEVYYRFLVTCGGLARLERVKFGQYTIMVDWMTSGEVPLGSPTTLNLAVWAHGEELRFFVDGVYQFSAMGINPLNGQIGVYARSGGETAVTVSFSNLKIFELTE